jgi:hypothetical protein
LESVWQKKKRVEGAGQREGEWNLLSVDEDDGAEPPGPTAERALAWDLYSPFFCCCFLGSTRDGMANESSVQYITQ